MASETKMKYNLMSFIKYIVWGLLFMILLTYAFGWVDLVDNKMLTGNWFKDFSKSITYYVGWIIPYWWLVILMGALLISLVIAGVKFGISKLR